MVTVGPYAKDDYMPMTDDNPLPMLWYTMTQNVFLKKLFWVHSIAISVSVVCLSNHIAKLHQFFGHIDCDHGLVLLLVRH